MSVVLLHFHIFLQLYCTSNNPQKFLRNQILKFHVKSKKFDLFEFRASGETYSVSLGLGHCPTVLGWGHQVTLIYQRRPIPKYKLVSLCIAGRPELFWLRFRQRFVAHLLWLQPDLVKPVKSILNQIFKYVVAIISLFEGEKVNKKASPIKIYIFIVAMITPNRIK